MSVVCELMWAHIALTTRTLYRLYTICVVIRNELEMKCKIRQFLYSSALTTLRTYCTHSKWETSFTIAYGLRIHRSNLWHATSTSDFNFFVCVLFCCFFSLSELFSRFEMEIKEIQVNFVNFIDDKQQQQTQKQWQASRKAMPNRFEYIFMYFLNKNPQYCVFCIFAVGCGDVTTMWKYRKKQQNNWENRTKWKKNVYANWFDNDSLNWLRTCSCMCTHICHYIHFLVNVTQFTFFFLCLFHNSEYFFPFSAKFVSLQRFVRRWNECGCKGP